MKRLMALGDFLFGAFLIGGPPTYLFHLTGFAPEFVYEYTRQHESQTLLGYDVGVWRMALSGGVCWGLAMLAFVLTIRYRRRHRILPIAVLQTEIGAGIVGAVVFTIYHALPTRVA